MSSVVHGCSDDRLALGRRGALSSAEWQELADHLAACSECRIAWTLAADFERSALPAPGDEIVLRRAAKAALARRRGGGRQVVRVVFAAAVVLAVAAAASGAVMLGHHLRGSHREPSGSPRGVPASLHPAASPATVSRTAPQTAPASEAGALAGPQAQVGEPSLPTRDSRDLPRSPTRPAPAPASPPSRPAPSAAPPVAEDAATLFSRAIKEREQGKHSDAIGTFRALQRRFPQTPQALVSLVSLADLSLGSGDPAEALVGFDAYLAAAPSGPLVTEALLGKARALVALGRVTEASAVSREIARRYPGSPQARQSPAQPGEAP